MTAEDEGRGVSSGLRFGLSIEPSLAKRIRLRVDDLFERGLGLGPCVNVAGLGEDALHTYGQARPDPSEDTEFFLSEELLARGVEAYRNFTHGRSVSDPLINVPEVLEVMSSAALWKACEEELGKEWRFGYVKLRRFFVNELTDFDTTFWHYDDNATNFRKLIVYLSPMESLEDGPFWYVLGSPAVRRQLTPTRDGTYTIEESILVQTFGRESLHPVLGSEGTAFLTDTTGWHRGSRPKHHDRYVLYINLVVEPEYGGKGAEMLVRGDELQRLGCDATRFKDYSVI